MNSAKSVALCMVSFLLGNFSNRLFNGNSWGDLHSIKSFLGSKYDCSAVVLQRNHISRLLNSNLQRLAQLTCDCLDAKTSIGGAFCPHQTATGHITDNRLIEYLKEFFKGKRIGSFGDGRGEYKKALDNVAAIYDAYDGAPSTENVTNRRVKFLDLSVPQYSLPTYDYVMSLEVGEHIPQQFEQTFLDNVARYAKEGIVLSWAVPGPGGYEHVNMQPLDYVIGEVERRGFKRDATISKQLQKAAKLWWLQNTTNFYRRIGHYYAV